MNSNQARIASTALFLVAAAAPSLSCSEKQTVVLNPTNEDRARAIDELDAATAVVREMAAARTIPYERRRAAKCVVVAKIGSGAFLVGGSKGSGVVTCRTAKAWSGPAFIGLSGVSAGFQIGGQSQDVVMLVQSAVAMNKLFTKSFQLGGDASVAAGPVGESGQAAANVKGADVITYGRSKGLFAGAELSGVWIKHDGAALAGLYGPTNADLRKILDGATPIPVEARPFLAQVALAFPPG